MRLDAAGFTKLEELYVYLPNSEQNHDQISCKPEGLPHHHC
jgi:hypothetical protein